MNPHTNKNLILAYAPIVGFSLLFILIWSFPVIVLSVGLEPAMVVFRFFENICHHDIHSTYTIAGVYLPVCIRCTGIYSGIFIGMVIFILLKPSLQTISTRFILNGMMITGALIAIDAGSNILNLKPENFVLKVITGCLFGLTIGIFLFRIKTIILQQDMRSTHG